MQPPQPSTAPVPNRIPVLGDTSNSRDCHLPGLSAALPQAMQFRGIDNLPARLWPTSSMVLQRPDSPYPGDPAIRTRTAYSSTTIPRRLPPQISVVPTGNISRLRMRESVILIRHSGYHARGLRAICTLIHRFYRVQGQSIITSTSRATSISGDQPT
ncbi:hypothetical protein N7G274_010182 [Stereocaulon virgatum]|uniref:Uncharacterized protein n=1 Tax=Stereocaulon virgatum TaxID=373712 RepID=A0ABR3ZU21_9LECA